jgi:hypothetical protein
MPESSFGGKIRQKQHYKIKSVIYKVDQKIWQTLEHNQYSEKERYCQS